MCSMISVSLFLIFSEIIQVWKTDLYNLQYQERDFLEYVNEMQIMSKVIWEIFTDTQP